MDRDLNAKIAGTTSIGTAKLSDRLFGYADFAEFMDGAEWDQLRSHDSTNDREDRVIYTATTSDLQFWAISFNLKFHFD